MKTRFSTLALLYAFFVVVTPLFADNLLDFDSAEQGNAEAQYSIGCCYANGEGVAQDYTEAVKWYRKAAEQGFAEAQFQLAWCYTNGEGVETDRSEAVKWYHKAAEQGDANAQYNLGCCYANGEGVAQDYTEAVKWYRKAAEQGFAEAQYNLGCCYYNGEGVAPDYAEAVKWIRKAAEHGHADAKQALEQMNWILFFIHTVYSIFGGTAAGRLFFIMICFALVLIMKGVSVIRVVLGKAIPSKRAGARPGAQPPSSQGRTD